MSTPTNFNSAGSLASNQQIMQAIEEQANLQRPNYTPEREALILDIVVRNLSEQGVTFTPQEKEEFVCLFREKVTAAPSLDHSRPAAIGQACLNPPQVTSGQEIVSLAPPTQEEVMRRSLNAWAAKEGGRAKEAANRIMQAFLNKSPSLDLSWLNLKTLPPEVGNLTNLRKLYLNSNHFTTLPPEIGNLVSLQWLDLCRNQLTKLPSEIGNLTNLTDFFLNFNKIASLPLEIRNLTKLIRFFLESNKLVQLPAEIGSLASLQQLVLKKNQLTSLPAKIGDLASLRNLFLEDNQLTFLPPEIGNLFNLEFINFSDNVGLNSLPLSLRHCRQLTFLPAAGTAILQEDIDSILEFTRKARQQEANVLFPLRLQAWSAYAGNSLNIDSLLKVLDEDEKGVLNEWLVRLEKTRDFAADQKKLAKIVVGILATACERPDFRESLVAQAIANNEACQDRSAMALNEIFVEWKIESLEKKASTKEKLQLMAGAARTLALRKALQSMLGARSTGLEESVEIYLYYEINLRHKLNLLTAIESMAYANIGKRDWIQETKLFDYVNDTYLEHLVGMKAFENLVKQDSGFNSEWDSVKEKFDQAMEQLEQEKDLVEEGVYLQRFNQLSSDREMTWRKLAIEWAKSFLNQKP